MLYCNAVWVADARAPRDGRFIETLGTYNPLSEPSEVKLHEDRVRLWLTRGAQPSDPVRDILKRQGLMGSRGAVTAAVQES